MKKRFEDQTAIISGGGGDIGRAIALSFAREGASVALGDCRPRSAVGPLLKELKRLGARTHYCQVNVADAGAVRQWVRQVERQLGPPDLIVPNAAQVTARNLRELTPREWSQEMRVNLDGAFFLAQAATKLLLKRGRRGRVVFVGSWAAHTVHLNIPAYCVSKAALRSLCRCLALEMAPHGITVNEIAPGFVDGGLSGRMWKAHPARRSEARRKTPVHQLIDCNEVAVQVLHLCDPGNRHITGATLVMDGGLSLVSP